jgi:hypothetical protein
MFPVQNGTKQDVSSPLLFNITLKYAITNIQENHEGLKLIHISFCSLLTLFATTEKNKDLLLTRMELV